MRIYPLYVLRTWSVLYLEAQSSYLSKLLDAFPFGDPSRNRAEAYYVILCSTLSSPKGGSFCFNAHASLSLSPAYRIMSSNHQQRSPSNTPRPAENLESDISMLASLLNRNTASAESTEDVDVAELLRQLETADGIAQGVESRLDGIIEHLNGMLQSLESNEGDKFAEAAERPETVISATMSSVSPVDDV